MPSTNARCLPLIALLAPNLTLKPPPRVRLKTIHHRTTSVTPNDLGHERTSPWWHSHSWLCSADCNSWLRCDSFSDNKKNEHCHPACPEVNRGERSPPPLLQLVIPSEARRFCGRSRGICFFFLSLPLLDTFFLTRDPSHVIITVYSPSFENYALNLLSQLQRFHAVANPSLRNPYLLIFFRTLFTLFCTIAQRNSSLFNLLRTLYQNTGGVGVTHSGSSCGIPLYPEHSLRRAPFAYWDRISLLANLSLVLVTGITLLGYWSVALCGY